MSALGCSPMPRAIEAFHPRSVDAHPPHMPQKLCSLGAAWFSLEPVGVFCRGKGCFEFIFLFFLSY